jgi:hypothetical protein
MMQESRATLILVWWPLRVHLWDGSLSYLQSIGLMLLLSTKVGRTYTNQIQLLFAGELLDAIRQTRLG